jgi:hypothetical protein
MAGVNTYILSFTHVHPVLCDGAALTLCNTIRFHYFDSPQIQVSVCDAVASDSAKTSQAISEGGAKREESPCKALQEGFILAVVLQPHLAPVAKSCLLLPAP